MSDLVRRLCIAALSGAIVLLLHSSAMAEPSDDEQPQAFHICAFGHAGDPPGHAVGTLRALIARRIACQNALSISLETDVASMAAEHGEELESISGATNAFFVLKSSVADFQAVLIGKSENTLDKSLRDVFEAVEAMEAALNSVGDDAQLANVDLQNILQKQQQTLQMMSNISKMLYDTAQSVIRKIGG